MTWVEEAVGSGYGIENLPYGVFSEQGDDRTRVGVRVGDFVVDAGALARESLLPEPLGAPNLNPLLAAGRQAWDDTRAALTVLLTSDEHRAAVEPHLLPIDGVSLHLPFAVADYVDFFSSEQHAINLGRMFRPDAEPLLPNWRHLPVGYHGRAGTVVVSGTPVRRPSGQVLAADGPKFGPSRRLDLELEMGVVVGGPTEPGSSMSIDDAAEHIFGVALVNDWSARDIQAWEYQPLGPFLGKSFATSIAPWVVPLAALDHARVPTPAQDPPVFDYLVSGRNWGFDIDLEIRLSSTAMRQAGLAPVTVSRTNFRHMYWSVAQQLAHMTVNGASLRPGDLYASGTISGPTESEFGSLIELTWNGTRPLALPDGTQRTFLEDGDEVQLAGWAGPVRLAAVTGRITA